MKLDWTSTRLTLQEPLRISRATLVEREAVWVRLTHAGRTGYGEVVTSPRLGLTVERIEADLTEAAHWLAGSAEPEQLRIRLPALRARLSEALPVACAVDVAVHDWLASSANLTLDEYLGAPQWDSVPTAYTIGVVEPSAAVTAATRLVAAGFTTLKLKLGTPDPVDDLARVRAVRAAAPHVRLLLDPNGAWDARTAIAVLSRLLEFEIAAVEQPTPPGRLDELAAVADSVPVPIIADEDAATVDALRRLPTSIAGINIKLAECGGLDAALAMIDWANRSQRAVMLGCQASTSLSIAAAAHLTGYARWVDLDGHLLITDDPWSGLTGSDGLLRRPPGLGLGVRRLTGAELGTLRPSSSAGVEARRGGWV
ncbi:peptide epimerase [Nocardia sp. 2]|uniref:Peptide epimerase n=1 Tax=Nocardia acididurans TaxID=2802282 RepID=A0ABS1MIF7_9NOCA|nr:enolase C-terminal domain-like protein [Nocardia acididurans]MBL1079464.1 peptide epimerase [Nocardia acididurans]